MILKVKVYPSSGREEIIKISNDEYKVYLKKPAEDNKANIELLKLFKKKFKKPARISKGLKSRDKIVEIID
ncbi:putative ACR, YggU family [uncultured archaeon]|nr:putative ACR, YggU family [uncultured archaeon]